MEMYDIKTIQYSGRPLFQTAKAVSPSNFSNSLEDMACFIYVLKGRNNIVEGHGRHELNRKEGILKSCGNFLASYVKDEDGSDYEAVVIYFYPDIIKELYENELPNIVKNAQSAGPPRKVVGNELIEKFINGLFIYFDNEEMMDEELAKLKIKELVMILLKSNYFEGVVDFFKDLFSNKEKSFRSIVENNIYNNLSMEELAHLTYKSLSTFKRDFKKEFNDSPAKYIKKKKLEKAANLLLTSDESVSNIAYDCGFQDISTFSTVFSAQYGQSPSKFRAEKV